MSDQLIPVFSGEMSGVSVLLVDARLLHGFLEVARDFSTWIKDRIEEYGFIEAIDFLIPQIRGIKKGRGGDRRSIEYHLSIDMAKELGMIERNEKGRQIRRHFLEMERIAKAKSIANISTPPERKTKQALPGCLTLEHQDDIKTLVIKNAEALPHEQRKGFTIKQWSAIKKKFGCAYKEIPDAEFLNVISLLSRLPAEGELMPTANLSITLNLPPLVDNRAKRFLITQQRDEMLMLWPLDDNQMVMTFDQAVRELNSSGEYLAMKKESVSIAKMVMDYIPAQHLPDLIETAGRRLKAIQS